MSEHPAAQIPKPRDEQVFERCNEVLWRCILGDETIQLHGRRGQPQHGVDLTGIRDGQPDSIVGVQCKLKSEGQKLTEAEVRDEVAKAVTFSPSLSEYIIVTTAPDDSTMQQLALELSISASKNRAKPIKIRVWGWGTLERTIRRYPEAVSAFDPSHTAQGDQILREVGELSGSMAVFRQEMAVIHRSVTQGQGISPIVADTAVQSVLERQVNSYTELVSSDPDTARRLLQKLQAELDDDVRADIRFRVAANMAACDFNLADEEAAARGLIAAYSLDPENPKAIAHRALGLLLLGDWTALKVFAETQLSKQPENAPLAAHYIRGMIADSTVTAPLAHVPVVVRNTPEVAEAHISWLMDRGRQGEWWDAAIAAHEAHPDSDAVTEMYSCALLERIVVRVGGPDRESLTEDERADVEKAIGIFEARWPQLRDDHPHAREESVLIPINLIVAYRLGHQSKQAVDTAHEALARFPGNAHVAKAAASLFMEQGEGARAGALLSALEVDRETVMMRFGVAMAREDWDTVSDLVDNHLALFPESEHSVARAARILADLNGSPLDERREVLEAELDKFRGHVQALVALARDAREHGLDDLGNSYFTSAGVAFDSGDNGYRARVSIASEALARSQPNVAADLLTDRVPLDADTFELGLLARALVFDCPIRERAIRFFEDLAPEVRSLAHFQTYHGILHVNRGAPDEAVSPFSAAFDLEPSVDTLMDLVGVHQRLGDTDAIGELLQREGIDTLPGSPLARINLAHFLSCFCDNTSALEAGYYAVIDGLDQASVVRKFLGLIIRDGMGPLPPRTEVLDPVVGIGAWIRLISDRGDSFEALVGEEVDRPWGAKADPANPFVAKALALKAGGSFEHVAASGLRETWTVEQVKPRWLQAFHYLSKEFGQRFPEAQGFFSTKIEGDDFEPLLEQVRRHSEALSHQANLYLVRGLPLALAAGKGPGGGIAMADYLTSIGEDLLVCHGTEEELSRALARIGDNQRSGAILDAVTAWFAAGLGVFPVLKERLGPLTIPRSEFGRIQEIVAHLGPVPDRETMTLTYQGGQYVQRIITPEIQAERRREFQSRLAAIEEACAIEPVVIPSGLPESGDRLLNVPLGDAFVPAVVARQQGLLLSEDMVMREVAEGVFEAKGVWLQPVLLSAVQAETMDWGDYCDALVQLAAHRHGHVFMNAQVLLSVFEHDTSTELVKLEALCAYVGVANAERHSLIASVAGVINVIWDDAKAAEEKVGTATDLLFGALLVHDGGKVHAVRAQALVKKLNEAPGSQLTSWLSDRSIRPSDPYGADGSNSLTDSPGDQPRGAP
ncbi:MAG: hypothetical protein OXI76_09490 [Gemmatimonadota bacterium]|nr:hypothetical protein [Gemmatimonadota bacterium]